MPQVIIDTSGSEDKPYRAYLSGVDTRAITWVTLVCLVGVEVSGGTGGGRVPLSVNIVLGISVPKLVVVFSVFEVKLGGHTGVGGGHEGGGRCHEGEGNNLGQLFRNGERKKILVLEKRFVRRGHLSHARFSSKFWPKILKLLFVYAPPTLQLKRFTTNPRAVSPRDRRLMERKTTNHIMWTSDIQTKVRRYKTP